MKSFQVELANLLDFENILFFLKNPVLLKWHEIFGNIGVIYIHREREKKKREREVEKKKDR